MSKKTLSDGAVHANGIRSLRKYHREVFFAQNGFGPYQCFLCTEEVTFDTTAVHHLDHDHDNNEPSNLAAAHAGCHRRHHASARKGIKRGPNKNKSTYVPTESHRESISIAQKARWVDAEYKEIFCSCGAGPYKGEHGLAIHQARMKCGVDLELEKE